MEPGQRPKQRHGGHVLPHVCCGVPGVGPKTVLRPCKEGTSVDEMLGDTYITVKSGQAVCILPP
jgi:hypothetical protein